MFSSAFNTISPVIMVEKLKNMHVNLYHILWILSFLTDREQCVQFKDTMSSMIVTNTGAPRGVSSHLSFSHSTQVTAELLMSKVK